MWLCVKFCGHPKLNFLMCLIHFGEWGKKRLKKFDKGWILKSLVLKIIWSHEHTRHITKTVFQMILQKKKKKKKNPNFFKISVPLEFYWSSLFFDRSKYEEEKQDFDLESRVHSIPSRFISTNWTFLHVHFDTCPIPLNRSDFDFQKHIGIRSDFSKSFFCLSLRFLSDSSLDPFSLSLFLFFFFLSFSWSKFQRFSS